MNRALSGFLYLASGFLIDALCVLQSVRVGNGPLLRSLAGITGVPFCQIPVVTRAGFPVVRIAPGFPFGTVTQVPDLALDLFALVITSRERGSRGVSGEVDGIGSFRDGGQMLLIFLGGLTCDGILMLSLEMSLRGLFPGFDAFSNGFGGIFLQKGTGAPAGQKFASKRMCRRAIGKPRPSL